jgi:DNA-directed RNA polymerase subunit omega
MARVTVEDCIDKVDSRFELVMIAAQRARRIGSGSALTIDRDNDKNPVIALREIAEETIDVDNIRNEIIQHNQRVILMDDEDDVIDFMRGEHDDTFGMNFADRVERDTDDDDDDFGDDFADDDDE